MTSEHFPSHFSIDSAPLRVWSSIITLHRQGMKPTQASVTITGVASAFSPGPFAGLLRQKT